MNDPALARRVSKTGAALCLILGPATLLVGTLIHPANERDESVQFGVAVDHLDRWLIGHIFNLTALLILIGAVISVAYLIREREPLFAVVGGALGVIGLTASVGYIAIHGFLEWQAARGGDSEQMAQLFEGAFKSPAVFIPFGILPGALGAGVLLLALGLWRQKIAPFWAAAALAAAPPLSGGGTPILLAVNPMVVGGAALLTISLAWLGRRVLSWSDEEWEHPPSYEGRETSAGPAPASSSTA